MTLATRRRSYWLLFVSAVLILGTATELSLSIFGRSFDLAPFREAKAVFAWTAFGVSVESPAFAAMGAILLSLFAVVVLFAILVSFRKTASEEIFFLAFWALSCAFESGRILIARFYEAGAPPAWMDVATRVVLAARFGGYGAFFLAGLRSAGFRNERPGRAVLAAVGIGAAAASILPIDTGILQPTLLIRSAYPAEQLILVVGLALITGANLLVAVESTGENVFRMVALGAVSLLAGQTILISAWRPELILLGLALLTLGAQLFVSRLHAHYLWQ